MPCTSAGLAIGFDSWLAIHWENFVHFKIQTFKFLISHSTMDLGNYFFSKVFIILETNPLILPSVCVLWSQVNFRLDNRLWMLQYQFMSLFWKNFSELRLEGKLKDTDACFFLLANDWSVA